MKNGDNIIYVLIFTKLFKYKLYVLAGYPRYTDDEFSFAFFFYLFRTIRTSWISRWLDDEQFTTEKCNIHEQKCILLNKSNVLWQS